MTDFLNQIAAAKRTRGVFRDLTIPQPGEGCYLDAFDHVLKRPKTGPKRRRIPISPREKVFAIKVYRKRCSINLISEVLTRSTSQVQKWLKKAAERGILRLVDLRKMPHCTRMRTASRARATLLKLLDAWQRYMSGEEEEPP